MYVTDYLVSALVNSHDSPRDILEGVFGTEPIPKGTATEEMLNSFTCGWEVECYINAKFARGETVQRHTVSLDTVEDLPTEHQFAILKQYFSYYTGEAMLRTVGDKYEAGDGYAKLYVDTVGKLGKKPNSYYKQKAVERGKDYMKQYAGHYFGMIVVERIAAGDIVKPEQVLEKIGFIKFIKAGDLNPRLGWTPDGSSFYTQPKVPISDVEGVSRDALQTKVTAEMQKRGISIAKIKDDGSLDSIRGYESFEFESVAFKGGREALDHLKKLFAFISEHGATTSDCGLHISFGAPRMYSPAKLALFMGEKGIARAFGREENEFAELRMPKVKRAFGHKSSLQQELLSDLKKASSGDDAALTRFEKMINDRLSIYEKRRSFRVRNNNTIEFRSMGGAGYHKKYREIEQNVVRLAWALYAASHPEYLRDKYIARLYAIVGNPKEETNYRYTLRDFLNCKIILWSGSSVYDGDKWVPVGDGAETSLRAGKKYGASDLKRMKGFINQRQLTNPVYLVTTKGKTLNAAYVKELMDNKGDALYRELASN